MPTKLNLLGNVFGRFTVLGPGPLSGVKTTWRCKCTCGTIKVVATTHLRSGKTLSCGCLQRERATGVAPVHGESKTPLFRVWSSMLGRCKNAKHRFFSYYGGRGIRICRAWSESYIAFRDWALANGYSRELWLDRRNNDGDYRPSNCRWTTRKESNRNKRNNTLVTAFGETKCVSAWVDDERCVVSYANLFRRLFKAKWPVTKALMTPARKQKRK